MNICFLRSRRSQITKKKPDYAEETTLCRGTRLLRNNRLCIRIQILKRLPRINEIIQRKLDYTEETKCPRRNQITQRKPDYTEETRSCRRNQITMKKLDYPEETRLCRRNQIKKPDYPEETKLPIRNQITQKK